MITLSWPANPPSELVSVFEVWEQLDNGFWNYKITVPEPVYSFEPTSHLYRWKVRAVNFVGVSEFGPVAEGPGAPSVPGPITVTIS